MKDFVIKYYCINSSLLNNAHFAKSAHSILLLASAAKKFAASAVIFFACAKFMPSPFFHLTFFTVTHY